MATNPGVGTVGTATEKAFSRPEQQTPDKLAERPDERDAGQFDALLESNLKNENQVNLQGGDLPLQEAPENLGDRILNAFQGMKENIDGRHQKIDNLLGGEEILSMQDMFKTQKAMTNLMMTEDLIGKVVGKSTQTLETLMKQQ